jgi:hypothetical protein
MAPSWVSCMRCHHCCSWTLTRSKTGIRGPTPLPVPARTTRPLILEEAHLLLTASFYRKRLPLITQLRRYRCPFVCLTATLPLSAESELKGLLNFTMPNILRASSDRPNLC